LAANHKNPVRLLQITDTHLHTDPSQILNGVDTDRSLRNVLRHIRREQAKADYVLATGDLTHDGSAETYRRLYDHLLGLETPVACLAGNHDDVEILRSSCTGKQVSCPRFISLQHWQIILIDSVIPGRSGGHLSTDELDFLHQRLLAEPNKFALICLHHQPVPIGSAWMDSMGLDNGNQLLTVIGNHSRVRGVLWGHVHQEFESKTGSARLLASPSTCMQFKPLCKDFALDDKPPGYRWLNLFDDGTLETGIEWVSD